jgi:4-amino-4-deoxy-L-arabinose transferase-like glycosyltransferase
MNSTGGRARLVYALWIAALLVLFGLHFVHLLADFPNNSPWMDYSKYTDEGWYANAAIRFWLTGHWYLRGDFNPAVALPVWPLLMALVFRFTGVSLLAARVVIVVIFGGNLLLSYCILRAQAARWVALLAVTILVTNPFLFAFSRLAILEPLVTFFLLLSWQMALRMRGASEGAVALLSAGIGLDLCLMVLTKTTGLLLIPSTLFLLVVGCGLNRRAALRALSVTCATGIGAWCAWFFLFVRPRYLPAWRYFFEANTWPHAEGFAGHVAAYWFAIHGTMWISPVLCVAVIALLVLSLFPLRKSDAPGADSRESLAVWRNPLAIASLLAAGGAIFFVGSENHPQPRYYETVIYPLAWLLALAAGALVTQRRNLALRIGGAAALAVVFGVCVDGTLRIADYVRHPEYTWLSAARGIEQYIDSHPAPNRLVLSISGDNLSLTTHLPAICDDFGSFDLPYRIHTYKPSWYAAWNDLDPGTVQDLSTQYSLEQVASFPAFDDPDRNVLVLYRMIPLPPAEQKYLTQEEEADNAGK